MSRAQINYGRASIKSIYNVQSIITSDNTEVIGLVRSLVEEVRCLREQLNSLKLSDMKDVEVDDTKDMSLLSYDQTQKCWIAVESEL
uniref:Uncharacterized protein n=1 Tax=viral metagenome TaxID=1070528 RepID=A0A6C0KB19_9ZZZZ